MSSLSEYAYMRDPCPLLAEEPYQRDVPVEPCRAVDGVQLAWMAGKCLTAWYVNISRF
jgi:hypothetical protein